MSLCHAGSLGVGGLVGAALARRMAITDLPQMVAGFHSLVKSHLGFPSRFIHSDPLPMDPLMGPSDHILI